MSAWIWILIGIIVLAVGWFALKTVLTLAVPLRVSGALLLKQELRKCHVQVEGLPKAFFDDCVSWAEDVSKVASFGSRAAFSRRAEFVRTIETLAQTITLWVSEPDGPMFKLRGTPPKNSYRAMFEKYDLKAVQ